MRAAADRRADGNARDSQNASQKYVEAAKSVQIEQHRVLILNERVARLENQLKVAMMAAQRDLVEDERRLQAKRVVMQQQWGGNGC